MKKKSLFDLALLIRYLGIGLVATGVHYLVFLALIATRFTDPLLASICGGIVGASVSFIGNKELCFTAIGTRRFQPIRFALVALATNIGNGLGLWFLIKSNLSPIIAQAVVTLTLTAVGFIAHRFWTFNHADITSASRTP
jgi:putative flippase GtrA